jgi:WD40 repeat protein
VISWSADREVRLWDVETGRCVETLENDRQASSLALAPRPAVGVTVSGLDTVFEIPENGTAQVWYPARLQGVIVHPGRRLYAGVVGEQIFLLVLEAAPPPASTDVA